MSDPVPYARTTLVDIDISFVRLVAFFVKASLAVIPAAIIVMFVFMALGLLFGTIFGQMPWMMHSRSI